MLMMMHKDLMRPADFLKSKTSSEILRIICQANWSPQGERYSAASLSVKLF